MNTRYRTLPRSARNARSFGLTWLACLLLSCIAVSVHAQSIALSQEQDAKQAGTSSDLLHDVLAQLRQHPSVRANFTQQRTNPALTQPQNSSGQLLFVAGHGMLWQIQQPYQQTLALTGSKTVSIDAAGHAQAVRNERGVSQIAQMLQAMLAGQIDPVLRQFSVAADGNTLQWTLRFTPKQARVAQVLRGIRLEGGAFLQGIHIDMQDGTQTDIRMTETRDGRALTALEEQALGLP
ncbi:LolA family protein [Dyella caseinilytica]|uniref:Outer membrane lipoprotein carrier protein LolA n=1 Tax=Dyella caseinilytica TaxID=1849581 RepID=A0ABX7GWF5_9GAMM|nr:outer membrane lipoprotein carrier protein LolA [Dyella caseinilytica]QRN54737.1 outer membrane lipoprotein carrier protein LolA [Dyella caseinilytica]